MHLLSQIIYSCIMLYMFRTVFPSIIRGSKLRIQQQYTDITTTTTTTTTQSTTTTALQFEY